MVRALLLRLIACAGKSATMTRITNTRRAVVIAVLVCAVSILFVVQAYNRSAPGPSLKAASAAQGRPQSQGRLHSRLSLQPEADRMRRRLGQRFVAAGREESVLTGTLTIGTERHVIRIARTQDEDDERVAIAIDSKAALLTWSGKEGAAVAGRQANGLERSLLERVALDSPDQFILAQLRGASYYTVERDVMPAEAGGSDNYAGPVWDIVRIGEPDIEGSNAPQSRWRLYHINSSTGLIDKVLSQESEEIVTAEITGWTKVAGELVPERIAWKRNDQIIMEIIFNGVSHGPRR
jgi:hypothetical protein